VGGNAAKVELSDYHVLPVSNDPHRKISGTEVNVPNGGAHSKSGQPAADALEAYVLAVATNHVCPFPDSVIDCVRSSNWNPFPHPL